MRSGRLRLCGQCISVNISLFPTVDGDMWCYQKPGFEALLLAELQRQQQCNQFCDTLLKTEGVSVPAHSSILSAISPHISSTLSSTPPPPPGQSRLLDFRALGACTLLRVVRLLYSGEMAGEGEEERQEAISAAAKLGIHGLVEVTRGDRKSKHEEEKGRRAEVGVHTEPLTPEEGQGRRERWRRDVRDGTTFLWKETLSDGEKDSWTQTEELLVEPPPSHQAASFETIDIATFQSLGEADPNVPYPQIRYVPVSLVHPRDESQAHRPSSAPKDYLQGSTAAGEKSVAVVVPPYISVSSSIPSFPPVAHRDAAAGGESEDDRLRQFQDNIPGFISYFLNPDTEEDSYRGRARGRRKAGAASALRAGTGERRARRPRARTGGRGRGRLTQMVDVQEVGVSRLQKLFLQRSARRASRTGQGGGAAGRNLCVKTRELLKPARSCRRRRMLDTCWEVSPKREALPQRGGAAGNRRRGSEKTSPQLDQDVRPVGRPQRSRAKPTSRSRSSPSTPFYNTHNLRASSPSIQPSPSPRLLPSAASYVCPASHLLHPTSVCPPAPPPHEEQPEHIDRLLEEVMRGLDILPINNNSAPHPQPRLPASSSSSTSLAQNKRQSQVVVGRGAACSSSANCEAPILQKQQEGELNEMLETILLSFEQHIGSCTAGEEVEPAAQSCKTPPVSGSHSHERQQDDEDEALARRSQPLKASSCRPAADNHVDGIPENVQAQSKRRKKRKKHQYMPSLEKKRERKPGSLSDTTTNMFHERGGKQLQQMPVMKLEQKGPLTVGATRPGHSSQNLDNKNSTLILEEPLQHNGSTSAGQTGHSPDRPRRNGQLLSLSDDESSTPPAHRQAVEPGGIKNKLELRKETQEEELTVLPHSEADVPTRRGKRRGAEAEGQTRDDGVVAKRVCHEQMPQQSPEACTPHSGSAETDPAERERLVNVETASLTSVRDRLQRREREEKAVRSEVKLGGTARWLTGEENKSSGGEKSDLEGDFEDGYPKDAENDNRVSRAAQTLSQWVETKPSVPSPSHSAVVLELTGCWEEDTDEDIDVIGGSNPAPDPVTISWTESSDGEDEDVDVVGEKTGYTSAVAIITGAFDFPTSKKRPALSDVSHLFELTDRQDVPRTHEGTGLILMVSLTKAGGCSTPLVCSSSLSALQLT